MLEKELNELTENLLKKTEAGKLQWEAGAFGGVLLQLGKLCVRLDRGERDVVHLKVTDEFDRALAEADSGYPNSPNGLESLYELARIRALGVREKLGRALEELKSI